MPETFKIILNNAAVTIYTNYIIEINAQLINKL